MEIKRQIVKQLKNHFKNHKQAIIILGPRQVGKTTISKKVFPDAKYLLVDEQPIKEALETYSSTVYSQIIGNAKQIIIDELHLISDPGRAVKILYDQFESMQIIVTGSSSLHIKNKTTESMAGRSIYYFMYPLTFSEYLVQSKIEGEINNRILEKILAQDNGNIAKVYDQQAILYQILTYGLYPEVLNTTDRELYLKSLADSAIFKDIVELDLIDNRAKALDLLKLLSYQIGNLVSYNELGSTVGLDSKTVKRYIDIFEQSYILYRLYPYSSKKRSEIGKSPKVYFYDIGLRNALINDFSAINLRPDAGALFENFIITELKKIIDYNNLNWNINYWRLKSGAEVDIVLSNSTGLFGCEIKLTNGKFSQNFLQKYPSAKSHILSSKNFY